MIRKGSLVRFKGKDKRLWDGQMLSVHEVIGDKAVLWFERKAKDKWSKITVRIIDLEEVC